MEINRMNDRLFKAIFGNEQYKGRTIALINAIFEFEGTELISDIEFIDRQIEPKYQDNKLSILDIRGITENNVKINIELQTVNDGNFPQRTLYYWSKMYCEDLKKGKEYTELTRTVTINLLNFDLLPYEDFHSLFGIYNLKRQYKLTDQFEMHFLEIKKWPHKNIKEMKRLDKWIAYFSNRLSEAEMEEIMMVEPMIKEAVDAEQEFMSDPNLRYEYHMREKEFRDYISAMGVQRRAGLAEGIEIGRHEGHREGLHEGVLQTAHNMLKKGLSVDIVAEVTSLPKEELQRLLHENQ